MLYLKLRQYLNSERAALNAMNSFTGFNALISPRRARQEDGTAKTTYIVLVPGGRRPSSVEKQLKIQFPHTDWTLIDVDADGFETEVSPEAAT